MVWISDESRKISTFPARPGRRVRREGLVRDGQCSQPVVCGPRVHRLIREQLPLPQGISRVVHDLDGPRIGPARWPRRAPLRGPDEGCPGPVLRQPDVLQAYRRVFLEVAKESGPGGVGHLVQQEQPVGERIRRRVPGDIRGEYQSPRRLEGRADVEALLPLDAGRPAHTRVGVEAVDGVDIVHGGQEQIFAVGEEQDRVLCPRLRKDGRRTACRVDCGGRRRDAGAGRD